MRVLRHLALLLLLSLPSLALSQAQTQPQTQVIGQMDSKECGSCHESQYQLWLPATHKTRGVVCAACHGDFHSGSLNACTTCHTGQHNLQYKQWQFVKDYIVEGDTSDYYCIVCHDPHNPKKTKVLLCNSCHGSPKNEPQPRKAFRTALQEEHNAFAKIAPEMDEDVWNRRTKSTPGKLMLGGGAVLLGGVVLFPYFYTGVAFVRWLRKRIHRGDTDNKGE